MNKKVSDILMKVYNYVELRAEEFGVPFLIGGFIGALVNRMRKRMSWAKFVASIFVAMFVGWVVGVSVTSFFNFNSPMIYAICSMAGAFSEDLLDEVEKLIKNLSEIIKNKLNSNRDVRQDNN